MRLPALIAAFALSAALSTATLAQTPATANGVTVNQARTWLIGLGGAVAEPEPAQGRTILRISDTLPWTLSFYACTELCDDAQFAASFTGPIAENQASAWNRENRFAKAVWIAPSGDGGDATVLLQYDLILTETGPDQLQDATAIWLQQLRAFTASLTEQSAAR